MTWLEDGTVVTLGIWGPGDIVGQALSRITPYQIECLTRLEATMYPLDVDPQQLINLLFLYTQQSEEMAVVRGHRRVDAMLYHFFELLSKKFGRHVETGQLIDLRLTHQDIADSLGTTRVTITRLMKQFQEQGIIERRSISQFIFREEERFWHYEI
ncbi:Crp/Fnr family transcriptional regulator [Alkalinema sp. FACHB-956]|nr:Crp/Fnr family transcriptional regulator [Alkalinema sp. FACHB-956]